MSSNNSCNGSSTEVADPSTLTLEEARLLVRRLRERQIGLLHENDELRSSCSRQEKACEQYQELYGGSPIADIAIDASGKITESNRTAEELFSVDSGVLIGCRFVDLITQECQDRYYLHRLRASESGLRETCEVSFDAGDDNTFSAQLLTVAERDAAGILARFRTALLPVDGIRGQDQSRIRHEAIREATSFAAKVLVRTSLWERHIKEILERLGQAAGASRALLFENYETDEGVLMMAKRYEWAALGCRSGPAESATWDLPYEASGFSRWVEVLQRGGVISGFVTSFPEAEARLLSSRGIRSLVVLPVFSGSVWWGFLGLDECQGKREWSSGDIECLKTATGTLGATIQREQTERTLLESERRYKSIFHGVEVSIWEKDYSDVVQGIRLLQLSGVKDLRRYLYDNRDALEHLRSLVRVNDVNEATLRTFGAGDKAELIAAMGEIFAPSPVETTIDELCAIAEGRARFRAETKCRTLHGNERTVLVSMPIPRTEEGFQHVTASLLDITERKAQEEQIWRQANFDPLTGLPNRTFFMRRLNQTVNERRRKKDGAALMFLDLDRFKWVNDNLGHAAGDELLGQVARRLLRCVRESDLVARLGGDEFTIILADVVDRGVAERLASKVLRILARPYRLMEADGYVSVSGSIGITFCPTDADDLETLLKHADSAMYRAKQAGANTYRFYLEQE